MTNLWLMTAAAFAGGLLSALGMGGGGILLMYLTAYAGMDQLEAQGINLVFFWPVAAVAVIMHWKNRLIRRQVLLPCLALGFLGVYAGTRLAAFLGSPPLSKLFGGFLLLVGLHELFTRPKKS